MSRWFRHYAGMMRDEKLVRAAVKAKQPVERVLWVWGAILESAAEINDGGRYEFDTGEAAYFLRCDDHEIGLIVECLGVDGRLVEGRVARWGDRQYSSDGSAERQRRYRERLRGGCDAKESGHQHNGDATVTSRDAVVTPQETDTEEETETESKKEKHIRACALESDWPKDFREQFWHAFPRKSGKAAAIRKLETIRKGGQVPWERMLAAVREYAAHVAGKDPQFTKMPSTWLNGGCWDDELPGTMAAVPAAQMVVAGFTWVHAEHRTWRPLAERFRREKGHGPPTDRDMGWRFPDAWVAEIEHENAA